MRVVRDLSHALEIALYTARNDVQVDAAVADVVQCSGHLRKQTCGDETWPDSHQEAYAFCDCGQCRNRCPRLRERLPLLEEAVGEASRY